MAGAGPREARARRAASWRALLVGYAFGAAAGLSPAPAQAGSDELIWEDGDQAVMLVPQDGEGAPPNDHPANVAAPDIERMLAGLSFRRVDDEGAPVPVFNPEQVGILGAALAVGLGRAAPSQDVRFSVIGAHRLSSDALVRRNRVTAGRVFFREGRLNMIFGELQSPYRKKNIYGRLEQDFYRRDYGSRTIPAERDAILVAHAATRLGEGEDGPRYDWAVFDPDAAPAPANPSAEAAKSEAAVPALPPGQADAAATEAPGEGRGGDVERRLRALRRLRDDDLISEEAYRQKVDEILEEL